MNTQTQVRPVPGETLRFMVVSAGKSSTTEYLVDLGANKRVGQCGCRDFECRRAPKLWPVLLTEPEIAWHEEADQYRCRHIKLAVRFYATAAATREWIANEQQDHETP